jgi:hypothetical protein
MIRGISAQGARLFLARHHLKRKHRHDDSAGNLKRRDRHVEKIQDRFAEHSEDQAYSQCDQDGPSGDSFPQLGCRTSRQVGAGIRYPERPDRRQQQQEAFPLIVLHVPITTRGMPIRARSVGALVPREHGSQGTLGFCELRRPARQSF